MKSISPWHKALYATTAALCTLVIAVPVTGAVADVVDPPSATVGGSVFDDRDADGQLDTGEPGIAGVSVSDGQRMVVTDAAGRYSFETAVERRATDLVFVTQPDNQTYGLVYGAGSGPFTGYSQSSLTMSRFHVTIPAGGSHTISRKLVVASNDGASDKFAVLNQIAP